MHIDRLERYWIYAVAAVMGAFGAALIASVTIFGISLPSPVGRVDPTNLDATEFANPGVEDLGNNRYTVRMVAHMWSFDIGQQTGQPAEIRLPAGAEVTFLVTSEDVTHGFQVEKHDVNLMVIPGQIARQSTRFSHPGVYHIICHEYCGPGHQNMVATIIVGDQEGDA